MNTRTKQVRDKYAEELARAEFLDNAEATIRNTFPIVVPEEARFIATTYGADVLCTFKVETLSDAIVAAERCNPAALFKVRHRGLSFLPEFSLPAEPESAEPAGAYAYDLRDYGHAAGGARAYLFWFVSIDQPGELPLKVCFHAEVKNLEGAHISAEIRYDKYGNASKSNVRAVEKSGHFNKSVSFWTTETAPGHFVFYT